jgi:hypothetical protein
VTCRSLDQLLAARSLGVRSFSCDAKSLRFQASVAEHRNRFRHLADLIVEIEG